MATVQQSIQIVRELLRDPKAQQPNDLLVLKKVLSKYQALLNALSNTGLAWATGELDLNVFAGQEDYEIVQVGNFGKALLVVSRDPANPAHIERPIEVYNIENIDFNWWLPNNFAGYIAGWDGSNTTAMRMAFFRKGGTNNIWVRVKPIPQLSASYKVLYAIGDWSASAALGSELLLPEHHDLAQTRAAISLLPHADWFADDTLNSKRRSELAKSLEKDELEYVGLFEEYIRSISQPRMSLRHAPSF
jgi:hypothetical protein